MPNRLVHTDAPTEMILEALGETSASIERMAIGLTWTSCRTTDAIGFAMSPGTATRTLPWPGSVAGRPLKEIAGWTRSLDPYEATVGMAAANAGINRHGNELLQSAIPLTGTAPGNLRVFEHFRPKLQGRKVVVIGRYPGLDQVLNGLNVKVLERAPVADDLPDTAADFVLPEADWVFITAMSLINKTFQRLAKLSENTVTVLMGPSMPWLEGWASFGIDYLAGIRVRDKERAEQVVLEGGGTRLFEDGVGYAVLDIGVQRMEALKAEIATSYARRETLKLEMTRWYQEGHGNRFPRSAELEWIESQLSGLDTKYKRLWDARNS